MTANSNNQTTLQREMARKIAASSETFLRRYSNVWIALSACAAVMALVVFRFERPYMMMVMMASAIATRIALGLGMIDTAKRIVVVTLVVGLIVVPFLITGISSPVVCAWPPAILMAGWLLGGRVALIVSGIAVASITLLWMSEEFGWVVWQVAARPPSVWWSTLFTSIVLSAATVWYLIQNYNAISSHQHDMAEELDALNAELGERLTFSEDQRDQVDQAYQNVRNDYESAYPMLMMASAIPGVAHDLNTPVGNTGMAASTLREQLDAFAQKVEAGSIRRAELNSFIAMTREGLNIIDRANYKVGELVGSLKELSIDQASQRRREFSLATVVNEVVLMLKPSLKLKPIRLEIDVSPELRLDSYPGPLGQVLGNLVQNTLVHGFEGRKAGTVTIRAKNESNGETTITVQDDGVGMSDEVRQRVFEPFFTTKADRGGSGVGLALCKRLVEETLRGTISVDSIVDYGSQFTIVIPRIVE